MFYSNTIIFDGIPSEEFGLMLVGKLGSDEQESGLLGGRVSIIEDTLLRRPSPIYYTSKQDSPLEFKLILSVIDNTKTLSRYDLSAIAGWLYGHSDYKELVICQDDLADYFYRCQVVELETIFVAGRAVGVSALVRCDAPHAYMRASSTVLTCSGSQTYTYYNNSNLNIPYLPIIVIEATGISESVSIQNTINPNSPFIITNIPPEGATIQVDCLRQIVTSESIPDVYNYFNFNFPEFVRGSNQLQLTGDFKLTIQNEFPMNVGA